MQVPGNQVKNSDEKMTKLALSWWRWGAPPPPWGAQGGFTAQWSSVSLPWSFLGRS